jgi:hypothetical protein
LEIGHSVLISDLQISWNLFLNEPKEATMDNIEEWVEQLQEAEQKLADAHGLLANLQSELKDAGRKKDMQAIGEVVERLARYGRLFEDIKASWTEVD